jgi:hypothetical protein
MKCPKCQFDNRKGQDSAANAVINSKSLVKNAGILIELKTNFAMNVVTILSLTKRPQTKF